MNEDNLVDGLNKLESRLGLLNGCNIDVWLNLEVVGLGCYDVDFLNSFVVLVNLFK